jgi:hypothetical protein
MHASSQQRAAGARRPSFFGSSGEMRRRKSCTMLIERKTRPLTAASARAPQPLTGSATINSSPLLDIGTIAKTDPIKTDSLCRLAVESGAVEPVAGRVEKLSDDHPPLISAVFAC